MITSGPDYMHECILVPFHHNMVIIWQVEQFSRQIHQRNCQFCNFTAILNLLRRWNLTKFLCSVLKLNNICVAGLATHFLVVVKWILRFMRGKCQKNGKKTRHITAFYGIKWRSMMPWTSGQMWVSAISALFSKSRYFWASFTKHNGQKCHFYGF